MRVTIRRFRKDDQEKTLRFLNSVFGRWGTDSEWRWKFEAVERALGRKSSIWVVEDGDEIVGHLAFIPMDLRVDGRVFPVCQLVDGALDSRYRAKGVYTSLVRTVLLDARENGNFVTFGFANKPAYRNYSKHGDFMTLCRVAKMVKIISFRNALSAIRPKAVAKKSSDARNDLKETTTLTKPDGLLTLLKLLPIALASFSHCLKFHQEANMKRKARNLIPNLQLVETECLEKELEELWARLSQNCPFAFERSSRYLKWRYSRPGIKYKAYIVKKAGYAVGYFILAFQEKCISINNLNLGTLRIGYIMDLVSERDLIEPLLLQAEQKFMEKKVCIAQCWTIKNSLWFKALQKMQYYQLPETTDEVTLVAKTSNPTWENMISSENISRMLILLNDTDHA